MEYKFKAKDIIESGQLDHENLKELRDWIDSVGATDVPDEMLVLALLACDKNQEEARKTVKGYFKYKNEAPEIFNDCDIDSEEMLPSLNTLHFAIMPKRTPKNHIVMFHKVHDTSFRKFDFLSHLRRSEALGNLLTNNDRPPSGVILVLDIRQLPFILIPKLKISLMVKYGRYLQEGLMLKIDSFHLIFSGYGFNHLMRIFRMAIEKDIFDKIVSHDSSIDNEEFHQNYVPVDCIPSDYGGELPCLEELSQNTINDIRRNEEWRKEEQKIRTKYKDLFLD